MLKSLNLINLFFNLIIIFLTFKFVLNSHWAEFGVLLLIALPILLLTVIIGLIIAIKSKNKAQSIKANSKPFYFLLIYYSFQLSLALIPFGLLTYNLLYNSIKHLS